MLQLIRGIAVILEATSNPSVNLHSLPVKYKKPLKLTKTPQWLLLKDLKHNHKKIKESEKELITWKSAAHLMMMMMVTVMMMTLSASWNIMMISQQGNWRFSVNYMTASQHHDSNFQESSWLWGTKLRQMLTCTEAHSQHVACSDLNCSYGRWWTYMRCQIWDFVRVLTGKQTPDMKWFYLYCELNGSLLCRKIQRLFLGIH